MTTTERIRAILVKNYKLNAEHLTADARLDALGIDSLGLVELMFSIEDEFGVTLPTETRPIAIFGDVVNLIDELIRAKSENAVLVSASLVHNSPTATPASTGASAAATQMTP